MPDTHSPMTIHLQYRLWIAELNFDITVLRIFGDYITELRAKRKEAELKSKSDYFEKEFTRVRAEIDEVRHEMQLGKMKLGAFARDAKPFDYKEFNQESQAPLKKRLSAYKADFRKINKEFEEFQGHWY